MANFDIALKKILKNEGWYQDNPNDAGNYFNGILLGTNKGITPSIYFSYYKVIPTKEKMQSLTDEEAGRIYKDFYWDRILGDKILSQSVAEIIFDHAVNCGVKSAVKGVQIIVETNVDGIMGNITLNALNNYNPQLFFDLYKKWRLFEYQRISKIKNNYVFISGWYNRVNSFEFEG
jgi:lysozyme family protein